MVDAGDPQDIAHATKRAKSRESAHKNTVERLLSTPSGRMWVYDHLAGCGIFRNPFSLEALAMAFSCGEMNVGQKMLAEVQRWCPEQYKVMIEEENARSSTNPDLRDGDPDGGDA